MSSSINLKLLETILSGEPDLHLEDQYPFFPLTSFGMPLPGAGFVAHAAQMGDAAPEYSGTGKNKVLVGHGASLHYLYRRALYDPKMSLPIMYKNAWHSVLFFPGTVGAAMIDDVAGPLPAPVMVVGKAPAPEDVSLRRNFSEGAVPALYQALQDAGNKNHLINDWYFTNACKWLPLDKTTVPASHVKECAVLLEQEIRLCRPRFILCFGGDAVKAVLGSEYNLQLMAGRVEKRTYQLSATPQPGDTFTTNVVALMHPSNVRRAPELYDDFVRQVNWFLSLLQNGTEVSREKSVRHVNVYTAEHLEQIVEGIRNDPNPEARIIAVDCEWHGERPQDAGAYLRTVQFSARDKEAFTVVLRHQGGIPAFKPSIAAARPLLQRLLLTDPIAGWRPRIGGHMLRADLPWLLDFGVDCRAEYAPAATPALSRTEGGWETSLMYHACNESTSYRLTDMLLRLTSAPRYDVSLDKWKEVYCKKHKMKSKDLEGYGECPSWVLYPEPWEGNPNYAGYDADCTRRIAIGHMHTLGMLDADCFGTDSWEPYWIAHRASLGFLEMELNGIAIDRKRLDELTTLFTWGYNTMLENFRQRISWPSFNPGSPQHCIAFLYGDEYCRKMDKETQQFMRIRPEGALSLGLEPVKTTDKPPVMWTDVVANNKMAVSTPSTDKEVLGILGARNPLAMQLRDIKFISQALKFTLKAPATDDLGVTLVDEDGHFEYEAGLPSFICADGRIRTHLSQLKETGRASSYRPNLQNQTKRREDDYKRIFGCWEPQEDGTNKYKGNYPELFKEPAYGYPLRSIFCATAGHVLVEADFKGAELAMLAWAADDPTMIEHVARNNLPESDPNYYDIHSQMAVRAFRLNCDPTKKGLKRLGRPGLRVAAKNVVFGVPYGRQAPAIQRQCKEEGVEVSIDDAQQLIEMYFNFYPRVKVFLAECRRRSQQEGWLAGCFGRKRRFKSTDDRKIIGEQERQAQNFVIQNGVADAMNCAIANFVDYRIANPQAQFKLLMQIHDALLFEVPIPALRAFLLGSNSQEAILTKCMSTDVLIYPRGLDNSPRPGQGPYRFGFDAELYLNWGVHPSAEELLALGVDSQVVSTFC